MASVFNEKSFLKKLDHLTPTQDSVQSLALWIIHHKINHDIICRLWLRKLNDGTFLKHIFCLLFIRRLINLF